MSPGVEGVDGLDGVEVPVDGFPGSVGVVGGTGSVGAGPVAGPEESPVPVEDDALANSTMKVSMRVEHPKDVSAPSFPSQ